MAYCHMLLQTFAALATHFSQLLLQSLGRWFMGLTGSISSLNSTTEDLVHVAMVRLCPTRGAVSRAVPLCPSHLTLRAIYTPFPSNIRAGMWPRPARRRYLPILNSA